MSSPLPPVRVEKALELMPELEALAPLRAEHLPDEIRGEETALADRPQGGLLTLAEVEARYIARVLAHTNGQIGAAAEILGIHRNTLTRKMKEYGL